MTSSPDNAARPMAIRLDGRGVLRVTGPDAREFLQGLITNDVTRVSESRAIYAALLTPQGKFLFDFFIVQHGDGLLLDCEAARAADLKKRLTLYKLRAKAEVEDVSEAFEVAVVVGGAGIGGEGPLGAPGGAPGTAWAVGDGVAFIDPRLAGLGARAIVAKGGAEKLAQDKGITLGNEEDWHAHRLALGVPEGGLDIEPEKSFLLESNADELNGVDFKKGCYIGQELTARTKHRGTIRKRIMPVNLDGPLPPFDTPVMAGEREVGQMRSGHGARALALLRLDRVEEAQAQGHGLTAGDAKLEVDKPGWLVF